MRRWLVPVWLLGVTSALAAGCAREPVPTVADGQLLYADNGCASCHGAAGRGDGPIAATSRRLPPISRPTARSSPASTSTPSRPRLPTASRSTSRSRSNAAEAHPHHSQGMPPFPHLSELERRSLALYVMSLRPESR
ncbi:MAG: cytochrome c [Vicinamibacterales bacterium]